ncbi:MAG: polysaccharide biosynthesis C-terminal domain-containing protein [Ferruginibacter sp.]|nr:polysaccharide biosynthesis C-terminal domain-containing protein [Chitinophagaceae bacterium]
MKESSRFYSSLGLLIILNVIIKPLWIFGIDRQVQNVVGTATYGIYFSLLNFSIVFSFLLDWGLTAFFNRQLAANPGSFTDRISQFLFIKLLFALLYAGIVCGVAYLSGIRHWDILGYVIIIQVLTSLFVFLRSIVTAHQWFNTDALLSVLDKALMILICGCLIYFPSFAGSGLTIEIFLLVQTGCTAFAVAVVLIVILRKGITFSFKTFTGNQQLFKSALPFAIVVLLMSVHYRLDGFLLERIHSNGAYEAGLYAGAYRLLDAANMMGYLLASFMLPFLTRQWSKGKMIDQVVLGIRHLLLVASLAVIITVVFLAPWIQEILYHNTDKAAISILQWCLPAIAGYSLIHIYGTVLTATGHIVQFGRITFLAVVLNIILNLLLIPGWGAKGCCFAALVSQVFYGVTTMLYARKKPGINIHPRSLFMYIFIGVILCLFYYLSMGVINNKWVLLGGAACVTIILAISLNLVSIRNLKKMVDQKNL